MNRDELLTKLAMELREWPGTESETQEKEHLACDWVFSFSREQWIAVPHQEAGNITMEEWLAERERLINKPRWSDAPDWAEWLAQGPYSGIWAWFSRKPVIIDQQNGYKAWEWLLGDMEYATKGAILEGHDWRTTLEARPQDQSAESRLHDETLSRDAGLKYDSEKPRVGLLSADMPRAIEEVAKVLTYGAEKYAPGNWQHVDNAEQRYLDASWRHELQRAKGESKDAETGLDHLAHKICCDLFRLELAMRACEDGES